MAPTLKLLLLLILATATATASAAQTPFDPRSVILPALKDMTTLQYYTLINQLGTISSALLTIDLGGQFLWVACEKSFKVSYQSPTYRPVGCSSAQCSFTNPPLCGECGSFTEPLCNNNTCSVIPDNSVTRFANYAPLGSDLISIRSTDGTIVRRSVTLPHFLFSCAPEYLLQGLAIDVQGIAGLGRTKISLPSQFSAAFNSTPKFAICLPPNDNGTGIIIFGDGPYNLLPNVDASKSLIYTPLLNNSVSTASGFGVGDPSYEYFIGVKSIKINGRAVTLNTTLLSINKEGFGGTKLSTVNPYTVLEKSIYKAVTNAFVKAVGNIPRVASVKPFGYCFNSTYLRRTRVGVAVPPIDLVLQDTTVDWRFYGTNSMVKVSDEVVCLGFVNGGLNPRTSIVIGGHQLEDNLLQFDLSASRLGFSSSLLVKQTSCSSFNFTYIP